MLTNELDGQEAFCTEGLWGRLIGTFAVFLASQQRPSIHVGSRKARTLLTLLAIQPDRFVSAEDLIPVLWPDRPAQGPGERGDAGVAAAIRPRSRRHRRQQRHVQAGSRRHR
jgi:hypothetical protein